MSNHSSKEQITTLNNGPDQGQGMNDLNMKNRNKDDDDDNDTNGTLGFHKKEQQQQQQQPQKNNTTETNTNDRRSISQSYPMNQMATSEFSKTLIQKLKEIYKNDVLPIERKYNLSKFCLPTNEEIQDSEFDAKPMVLMLGQYSTGKTTFIRHLIGRDFPAMHIGPEPTTDRFTALVDGSSDDDDDDDDDDNDDDDSVETDSGDVDDTRVDNNNSKASNTRDKEKEKRNNEYLPSDGRLLKGNSVTVVPDLPFSTLSSFGSGFLSHFVGSICSAPLLKHVTLIDTPGVLSGEKQRLSRSYDFSNVMKWFADRSDLILLLFDGHKLDISDELKDVIQTIRPNNDDKMRCILNKADSVTREQLVRVYGSLMWSMGKIFESPEVVRVYTGSYWERPLVHDDFKNMFETDESLLLNELMNLPKSCAERKLNEVVKRIRIIKVHLCIFTYLKRKTPRWFSKHAAMRGLIDNLEHVFEEVRTEYKLSAGDFPNVDKFRQCLEEVEDFSKLATADKHTLRKLDNLITKDIPAIMKGATKHSASSNKKLKSRKIKVRDSQDVDNLIDASPMKKQKSSGDRENITNLNLLVRKSFPFF